MSSPLIKVRTINTTVSATPVPSTIIQTDIHNSSFAIGFTVKVSNATAASYSVQFTLDDIWDMADPNTEALWLNHPTASVTASTASGGFTTPISAYRLYVISNVSAGEITLTGIQAGTCN